MTEQPSGPEQSAGGGGGDPACSLSNSRSAALRRALGVRKLRFATADELHASTGLLSGEVPPFGDPILAFPLHADDSVFENEQIAFNAGSLTDSIIMTVADWEGLAHPRHLRFSARDNKGRT